MDGSAKSNWTPANGKNDLLRELSKIAMTKLDEMVQKNRELFEV